MWTSEVHLAPSLRREFPNGLHPTLRERALQVLHDTCVTLCVTRATR